MSQDISKEAAGFSITTRNLGNVEVQLSTSASWSFSLFNPHLNQVRHKASQAQGSGEQHG